MQTFRHFPTDETDRRSQSLQRALSFGIVALHHHENTGGARIASQYDAAHADQADAGVAEFALDNGFDLLAQSLSQSFAMILGPALFHSFLSE